MFLDVLIRPYQIQDKEAVRSISRETSFLEHPRQDIVDDDEVLADVLVGYFIVHEPESCFVAVCEGQVVGYIVGLKNVRVARGMKVSNALFQFSIKIILRGTLLKRKNFIFFCRFMQSFFKGEFSYPDFSKEYPATLHINVLKKYRGQDIGSRLMRTYLDYLKNSNIRGVHLGTFSDGASVFFERLGFQQLFRGKKTYLQSYVGKDVNFYIYGKKL